MINDIRKLQEIARNVRIDVIKMIYEAQSGHPGGSLGIADVMVGIYFYAMGEGDRFVLSKGHCSPALYGVLAEKGIIPKEDLKGFRKAGVRSEELEVGKEKLPLQGHPKMDEARGIDMSTGSLGQGISAACGMAISSQVSVVGSQKTSAREAENGGQPTTDYRLPTTVYCVMGDGEQDEGEVWEAATFAAHYGLDNLIAVVDENGLQIDGATRVVMNVEPLVDRYRVFGWNVLEIDGHDFGEIMGALDKAKECKGKPTVIIAKTIKGKGVSFMEGKYEWHGKAPSEDEFNLAMQELSSG